MTKKLNVKFPVGAKAVLTRALENTNVYAEGNHYAGMTLTLDAGGRQLKAEVAELVAALPRDGRTLELSAAQAELLLQQLTIVSTADYNTRAVLTGKNFPYVVALVQAGLTKFDPQAFR